MEYNKKIDSYNVADVQAEGTEASERLRDVKITYYSDGKFFAESPLYRRIPEERIKPAKEKLFDFTLHNLNHNRMIDVYTFCTIMSEVERIILDER